MNIKRKFNNDGNSFEQMFKELMNSKINDFAASKTNRNVIGERGGINHV